MCIQVDKWVTSNNHILSQFFVVYTAQLHIVLRGLWITCYLDPTLSYYINISIILYTYIYISGWWFGTFLIFPYIGNNNPNWRNPWFFRGLGQPPTICIKLYIYIPIYIYISPLISHSITFFCVKYGEIFDILMVASMFRCHAPICTWVVSSWSTATGCWRGRKGLRRSGDDVYFTIFHQAWG